MEDSEEDLASDEEARQCLLLRRYRSDEALGEELEAARRGLHSRPWLQVNRAFEQDDAIATYVVHAYRCFKIPPLFPQPRPAIFVNSTPRA